MRAWSPDAERIMKERFGKDTVIALATADEGVPYVRNVNAYYEEGAFYVVTYGLSDKMQQIGRNPSVAVAGDWFTGRGKAVSLGSWGSPENRLIAKTLKAAFSQWIDNRHMDFSDPNTVILRIALTEGLLLSHGARYELSSNHT